ncbi:hypothetical protein TNCV_303941 [Trichonephila clavipes]|nr:hypothetical protein TNCV_303941 [Trichonephila clavipes]
MEHVKIGFSIRHVLGLILIDFQSHSKGVDVRVMTSMSSAKAKNSIDLLKIFPLCNNHIVIAQRKHLDDFLRDRTIRRLEGGHTQLEVSEELGIAQSVLSRL